MLLRSCFEGSELLVGLLCSFHYKFTNNSFRMVITWKTRNMRSFFPLKDKNDYKSCVIYKGDRSCGSRYIGETKLNAKVRWNEHNNPTKSLEPSKHLQSNIKHSFTWAVISDAPKNGKTRKNLKHHILLSGNLILMSKRTLKDWFCLEMVSHNANSQEGSAFFLLLSLLYCF